MGENMNKPVGRYYWESVVDGHFMAVPSEGTIHYEIDDFPLYTHPVKELTDDEIIAEAEKHDWLGLTSESEWQPEIDFARAILRKAQE